ncbi:hypothetical protein EEY24_03860 [Shewanella algae]|nr:hypothetical protein EEY24_03860 [Shewanella algae]
MLSRWLRLGFGLLFRFGKVQIDTLVLLLSLVFRLGLWRLRHGRSSVFELKRLITLLFCQPLRPVIEENTHCDQQYYDQDFKHLRPPFLECRANWRPCFVVLAIRQSHPALHRV